MGLRVTLVVVLLALAAGAQVLQQDMLREARALRVSAERLYSFAPTTFGPEWQNTQNDPNSFYKMARRFEVAWNEELATVDSTRELYGKVRKSFDKVKLFARLNMNAQEVDNIQRQLQRLDPIYGINPVKEASP